MRRIRWAPTGHGRNIGTIGKVGCFSFQSYKLVNAGEGGILVTDDPEIAARAIIMSGAYEPNWKKHPGLQNSFVHWQNRLPLYNLRMQNLSAAVIRPQLPGWRDRVAKGRANHDHVAAGWRQLGLSGGAAAAGAGRARAGFDPVQPDRATGRMRRRWPSRQRPRRAACRCRSSACREGNARAFWNWQFLGEVPDLPQDPRHADARLRRAPADPADRGRAGLHRPGPHRRGGSGKKLGETGAALHFPPCSRAGNAYTHPQSKRCGRSSGVEHNLAKVRVVSSNLIARSNWTTKRAPFRAPFRICPILTPWNPAQLPLALPPAPRANYPPRSAGVAQG